MSVVEVVGGVLLNATVDLIVVEVFVVIFVVVMVVLVVFVVFVGFVLVVGTVAGTLERIG